MHKVFTYTMVCLLLVGCGSATNESTPTLISVPTILPTSTPTVAPVPTHTPTATATPTEEPIQYVTLGSPFAFDCGDGIPRIWSNDAYNSVWKPGCNDDHHGHVDLFVPNDCEVNSFQGEIISPIDGNIKKYKFDGDWGYHLFLTKGTLISGIEDSIKFAGFENPNLNLISQIYLDFGHVNFVEGYVDKGESIGDVIPYQNSPTAPVQYKIAYKVVVIYMGQELSFSPTLFLQENEIWPCVLGSPYDCASEQFDYSDKCKP